MKKLIFLLLFPALAFAQSQDQNYVKTTVYKKASTEEAIDHDDPVHVAVQISYFDGLGRPVQQVAYKQSATGKDIITHIEYDAFGRQVRDYLPYAGSTPSLNYRPGAAAEVLDFYDQPLYENTLNPYSEKLLESSPLSRVFRQAAPGSDWALNPTGSDHSIKFDYRANGEDEVILFKAVATWSASLEIYNTSFIKDGFYEENQLYKTITKDENWTSGLNNTIEEFKDKEGRVILKRTYDQSTAHDTYYVYDNYGNLTYVIPPLVDTSGSVSQNTLDDLCYQYKYDFRNRLVEKKLPGKAWEYIVYDKLDRPVITGPALNPLGDGTVGWLVTKYDAFGRVAYTGWLKDDDPSPSTRASKQQVKNAETGNLHESRTSSPNTLNGVSIKYTTNIYPTSFSTLLTVNYYDDYDFPYMGSTPYIPQEIGDQLVATNVKGLPTGTWIRVLTNTPSHEENLILYDVKGRAIRNHHKNHLGGFTQTDYKLDFQGVVQKSETLHQRTSADVPVYVRDNFEYTPQGRLLTHSHTVDNNNTEMLSHNIYEELGQLGSSQVGGTDLTNYIGFQEVNYRYNIRGWLTDINDINDLTEDTGLWDDLFAFSIQYNKVGNSLGGAVQPLYNGNIAETFWRTGSDNILRKYGYGYDHLNRLKNAFFQVPEEVTPVINSYDETLSYDKNGNILSLQRTGGLDTTLQVLEIDDLTYTYSGNRLMKVMDATNNPQGFKDDSDGISDPEDDYDYDDYGNMILDDNKGIRSITYNHLNLPVGIDFGDTRSISYLYNAVGQKVKKTVNHGQPIYEVSETEYMNGGFQYNNEVLQFFPHAQGYVKHTPDKYGNPTFDYVYQYKDHLGNIRINYGLDPQTHVLKIYEENHYYPFGLKHGSYNSGKQKIKEETEIDPKRVVMVPNTGYLYRFNSMEWQDELDLNWYDFHARNYDPALGRWMNLDPLAEKYTNISLYAYVANNPVIYIDPDGKQIIILNHEDKDSREIFESIINNALGGNHIVEIDKNGKVSLKATGEKNDLTDEQKGFYEAFNEVVGSEHNVELTLKVNVPDVYVGSFKNGVLDVGDMMQFDNEKGGYSSASNMIHEVTEQHEKAKSGLTHAETDMSKKSNYEIYKKSHDKASSIEQSIFGFSVIGGGGLDTTFKERDGSTTRQVVNLKEKMKDGSGRSIPLNPRKPIKVTKTKGK